MLPFAVLVWCLHLCNIQLQKSISSFAGKCMTYHTHERRCNWKHLCGLFLCVKGELDWALCTCLCVQSYSKPHRKSWQFAVFPFSNFPRLVFHDTIYSLLRNSHMFPKAPHLETDAQLLPGPRCVPAGVCVYHPWGSRDMPMSLNAGGQLCPICTPITACLDRLLFTVGASDSLSFHAQCSLLPLMHLGWKRILVVIPAAKFHWKEQPQAWNNYIWSRASDCGNVIHNNYSEMSVLTISEYHKLYISSIFIFFNGIFQIKNQTHLITKECALWRMTRANLLWLTGEEAGWSNLVSWN